MARRPHGATTQRGGYASDRCFHSLTNHNRFRVNKHENFFVCGETSYANEHPALRVF